MSCGKGRKNWAIIARIFDKHAAIAANIDEAGVDTHVLTSLFASAAEWSARLRSESEAPLALTSLVECGELHQGGIRLSIRLPLRPLGTRGECSDSLITYASDTTETARGCAASHYRGRLGLIAKS
jgi:hypothetical protein